MIYLIGGLIEVKYQCVQRPAKIILNPENGKLDLTEKRRGMGDRYG